MISKTKLHQIGKMPIDKAYIKEIFRWSPAKPCRWELAAAVLLFVFTYPWIEPDYGCGLDSSYVWGVNWLFDNDYSTLTRLVYPFGPFLWLKLPTLEGHHFVFFICFFFVAKCFYVWQGLALARRCGCGLLPAVVIMIPSCLFANIDVLIVFDVAFMVLRWLLGRRWQWFSAAAVVAVFSMTIKVSIGVHTCSILFVGWIFALVKYRDYRQAALSALTVAVSVLVVGLAVYRNWAALARACQGIVHLVTGYSDALVLMPDHKLWALALFVLFTAVLIIMADSKETRLLCMLMLIPLFAFWKHSIVREDYLHFRQLIVFGSCFLLLVPLYMERRRLPGFACGVLALSMLFVNLGSLHQDNGCVPTTVRAGNFINLLTHSKRYVAQWQDNINQSMVTRRLDAAVLQRIGDGTVDCYPWEDVFIAANGLKWQPSTAVQFGAGNSAWVNHLAAQNFAGNPSAVDYVLLHRTDYGRENGLQSLDGRYLLNDEPEVMDSILLNYSVAETGWYGILLCKGRNSKQLACGEPVMTKAHWDEWIGIPASGGAALRVDVRTSANLNGRLRATFYKPDICYIDYRFADGREATYRFSPASARGGLWVGPMPQSYAELVALVSGDAMPPCPVAIRLRAKHPGWHHKDITLLFRKTMQ